MPGLASSGSVGVGRVEWRVELCCHVLSGGAAAYRNYLVLRTLIRSHPDIMQWAQSSDGGLWPKHNGGFSGDHIPSLVLSQTSVG